MIKVAIVESNRTVRESLETIVNLAADCGCVGAWATADEALPQLASLRPAVVLLDLGLPERAGVEWAALVQECVPTARVILLTVYEDPDRILRALRAGARGYLLKRSSPPEIVAAIRDARGSEPLEAAAAVRKTPHLGS